MKDFDRKQLWERLLEEGLVAGGSPTDGAPSTPWFLRLMLGVGGWIGAMFLFGFVTLLLGVEAGEGWLLLGGLVCAAAWLLFSKLGGANDFVRQFAFSASLVGQGFVLFGLIEVIASATLIALLMAALEVALLLLIRDFPHRVWAALAGSVAVLTVLHQRGLDFLGPAVFAAALAGVWLWEFSVSAQLADIFRATGYGFAVTAPVAIALIEKGWFGLGTSAGVKLWLGGGLVGAVLLVTVLLARVQEHHSLTADIRLQMLTAAAILATASVFAPGLGLAALILLLGFAHGNAVLAGLGMLELLAYLSSYYYATHLTLLQKSCWLIGCGIALLAAREILRRRRMQPREAEVLDA